MNYKKSIRQGEFMEILYVWIREYGPFRYQGFQLSGELQFDFNRTSGILSVNRNNNYVENFFRDRMDSIEKSSVVSNITALVGNNGAGKTTLLNFIKRYLVRAMRRISKKL